MVQRLHVHRCRALPRRLQRRRALRLAPLCRLRVRVAAEVQCPPPLLRLREATRHVLRRIAVIDANLAVLRVQRRTQLHVTLCRQHQRLQEAAVRQRQRRRAVEQTAGRQRHVQVHRAGRQTRARHHVVLHPRDRLHVQVVLPGGQRRHLRHAQHRVVQPRAPEAEGQFRLEPQRLALERVVRQVQAPHAWRNERLQRRARRTPAACQACHALAKRRGTSHAPVQRAQHARVHTVDALQALHDRAVERRVRTHLQEHRLRERLAHAAHGVGEAHGVRQVLHEVLGVDGRRVRHLLAAQRGEQPTAQRAALHVADRRAVGGHCRLHERRVERVRHHQRPAEHAVALQLRAQRLQLRLVAAHRQRVGTVVAPDHQLRVLFQVRRQLRLRQTHRRHAARIARIARVFGDGAPAVKRQLHRLLQRHRARRVRRADLARGVAHRGGRRHAPRAQLLHERQLYRRGGRLRHARGVGLLTVHRRQQVPPAQLLHDARALLQRRAVHWQRVQAVLAHSAPLRALSAEHEAHRSCGVFQRRGVNHVATECALAVLLQRRGNRYRVAHHGGTLRQQRAVRRQRPAERLQRGEVLRSRPQRQQLATHRARRRLRLGRPEEDELGERLCHRLCGRPRHMRYMRFPIIRHINTTIRHTTIRHTNTTILHTNTTIRHTTILHTNTTILHTNTTILHTNTTILHTNTTILHTNTTIHTRTLHTRTLTHTRDARRGGNHRHGRRLFQNEARVGAANAEAADNGAPRVLLRLRKGRLLQRQIQLPRLPQDVRVALLHLDRRGDLARVHAQRRLHHARHARRALHVPEVGLQRPDQQRRRSLRLAERSAQRPRLRLVARHGARAVGFRIRHRGRVCVGYTTHTLQQLLLHLPAGIRDGWLRAVVVHAAPADHRVNAVARRLRRAERFQHDDARALAAHVAVATTVEGEAVAVGRHGAPVGEA